MKNIKTAFSVVFEDKNSCLFNDKVFFINYETKNKVLIYTINVLRFYENYSHNLYFHHK